MTVNSASPSDLLLVKLKANADSLSFAIWNGWPLTGTQLLPRDAAQYTSNGAVRETNMGQLGE